ncbi:MAG TPA: bifunctional precorrin-2 dehydrogenase/sirohydrochlorin ferrochelatase [Myxococcales bacterium]|nr:bifunctional precorrin-2 dehydrogenase/sirohydrochlorin ferrochelatase [Myxococcales bacterium]
MELYPVFLHLRGRPVLLVGGGKVASGKIDALLAAGARVTVVAPRIDPRLLRDGVQRYERPFAPADLDGKWFAVAAAPPEVNREVARAAEKRRVFVNAVDDADSASAFLGGVVRKAGVTVAISTDGRAPALAGLLREALEAVLPEDLDAWVGAAQDLRAQWKAAGVPIPDRRPLLLRALNQLYAEVA